MCRLLRDMIRVVTNFYTVLVNDIMSLSVNLMDCDFDINCYIGTSSYYFYEGMDLVDDSIDDTFGALDRATDRFFDRVDKVIDFVGDVPDYAEEIFD